MITDSELIDPAPLNVFSATKPTPASASPVVLPDNEGPSEAALAVMPRADIAKFKPLSALVDANLAKAKALTVSPDDSPEEQQRKVAMAKQLREDVFGETRREAKRIHDALKKGINEIGDRIDSEERAIRLACKEVEEHLKKQEAAPAEFEKQRVDKIRLARLAIYLPLMEPGAQLLIDLGTLPDITWEKSLAEAQELHALRLKREADAEKARQEAEARRLAEEQRRREEEAAARERAAKELAERTAELAKVKAEAEAKETARRAELEELKKQQAEDRRRADEERRAAEERSRREFAELERQTREREAKEKAEREAREKQIAEERRREREAAAAERAQAEKARREAEEEAARVKAEADRIQREAADKAERERKAEAERERRAAAAPDVEKLRAYAAALAAVPLPPLASRAIGAGVEAGVVRMVEWINGQAAKLEGGQS